MTKTINEAQNFGNCALPLIDNGYLVMPAIEKRPAIKKWTTIDINEDQIAEWNKTHSRYSVSVRGDSVQAIDIDVYNQAIVERLTSFIKNRLGGRVLIRTGMPPKILIPVRSDISSKLFSNAYKDKEDRENKIEILAHRQHWLAFGIHPDTKKPYTWEDGSPLDTKAEDLPFIDDAFIDELFGEFYRLAAEYGLGTVDKMVEKEPDTPPSSNNKSIDYFTPCGRYTATVDSGSVVGMLRSVGWSATGRSQTPAGDPKIDLCRPGKQGGVSGSVIVNDKAILFHCFTSSDDLFEHDRTYTAFEVRKIIEFDGDKKACIQALIHEEYYDPLYRIDGTDTLRDKLIEMDVADKNLVREIRQFDQSNDGIKRILDWYEVCYKGIAKSELGAPHLTAHSLVSFLDKEIPDRKELLSPIITESSMLEVHAKTGTGKTFFSIGMATAIAGGGTFLNWHAPSPAGVIYVDGEMAEKELQERLRAAVAISDGDIEEIGDNLTLISAVGQEDGFGIPCIGTVDGQQAIESHITNFTRFLVLDNLSSLLKSTGSENDDQSWNPIIDWIVRLRKIGISVLFVHHSGKGGQSRGTSKREDLLDVVLNLKRPDDYDTDEGARFEVHFDKARGLYGKDARPFEAHLRVNKWVVKPVGLTTYEKVVELTGRGHTQSEIAEELGVTRPTVNKCVKKAVKEGKINNPPKAARGRKPAKDN